MKQVTYTLTRWSIIPALLLWTLVSCKKYVEIDPPIDQLTADKVFTDAGTVEAAVTGLYSYTFTSAFPFYYGTEFYGGMAADELYYRYTNYDNFKNNAYGPKTSTIASFWSAPYKIIYEANAIIENLPTTTVITEAKKKQYIGEAKFFRAYAHFLLTNFFGDVPLILTTKVSETELAVRSTKEKVLLQVIADLKDAATALIGSGNAKTRITPAAATALLARAYLYAKDWANAEITAGSLITSGSFHLETDLNKVFLRTSAESIFQASSDKSNPYYINSTILGSILVPDGTYKPYYLLTAPLLSAFEVGDKRKTDWTSYTTIAGENFYYPYKYKQVADPANAGDAEDYVLFRLGEQYLVRAEARAQQDKKDLAVDDVNEIRNRAGLGDKPYTISKTDLLLAIEQERRVELFLEGHRWFDVIRTGRADAVFGVIKSSTWKSTAVLFPIPFKELQSNPNLAPQNPGY